MEMIISMAILGVLFVTIMTLFGSTAINIGKNGRDIKNVNQAKSELNTAINDPTYTGANSQLENVETTVNVWGTDVPVRYISSKVEDTNNTSFFVYTMDYEGSPTGPDITEPPTTEPPDIGGGGNVVISDTETPIFLDFNKDGVFDVGTDLYVDLSCLDNFRYTGDANVVVDDYAWFGEWYSNKDLSIKTKSDFVITDGSTLGGAHGIDITSDNVYIESGGKLTNSTDDIYIKSNNVELESYASIYSVEDITLDVVNVSLSGTSQIRGEADARINIVDDLTLNTNSNIYFGGELNLKGDNIYLDGGSKIYAGNYKVDLSGNLIAKNNSEVGCGDGDLLIKVTNFSLDSGSFCSIYKSGNTIQIDASGDISLNNKAKLSNEGGDIDIDCINASLSNGSKIEIYNKAGLILDCRNDFTIYKSDLAIANSIKISAKTVKMAGTSDRYTNIGTNNNTRQGDIDFAVTDKIYYGEVGQSSAYLYTYGGSKNGFMLNSSGVSYANLEPTIDGEYFK